MDNVLVDFDSGIARLPDYRRKEFEGNFDNVPGIFDLMDPIEGAIDSYKELSQLFDTYVLSTAPWDNSSAWMHKADWIKRFLGKEAYKRLILSHHKNLLMGDFLIDDRTARGVDKFQGEHIHFGTKSFPDWATVVEYLRPFSDKN
jgi:5'(3')-deoxyribonucleotidase